MADADEQVQLRPLVIATAAKGLAEALAALEAVRKSDDHAWMVEATIAEWGIGEQSFGLQGAPTLAPNVAAAGLGRPLRNFCTAFLDAMQIELRDRLHALWRAVEASPSLRELGLQLAVTFMVTRKPPDGEYRDEMIHADAFDGTVIGLAFVCSKMGTRLYPDAVFTQAPVEQFIKESWSGNRAGLSPVKEGAHGLVRVMPPATLLIMPAAVAHARPDGRVQDHAPTGARWFARAHVELRPAAGRRAWDGTQRMEVALLVAHHVWRDPAFVAAAKAQLRAQGAALQSGFKGKADGQESHGRGAPWSARVEVEEGLRAAARREPEDMLVRVEV